MQIKIVISPNIPFVGAIFDVVAERFEHTACRRHLPAIEYLLHTHTVNTWAQRTSCDGKAVSNCYTMFQIVPFWNYRVYVC